MIKGTIFNIQKFCLHDGDGVRSCVFVKGCPLDCIWCHNPESKSTKPQMTYNRDRCTACGRCLKDCGGRSVVDGNVVIDRSKCTACGKCVENCLANANEICGYEITAEDAFKEVIKDKMFYDSTGGGITVSGGEPSYQPEFSLELLRMARDAGIGRAVESCGIGKREFYKEAAELGTTFLFDIKCMDGKKHKELTRVDNARILDNLEYLFEVGADVIIRMPMIPGCNDSEEDIAAICQFLQKHEGKYRYAEIMPYHKLGVGKSKRLGEDAGYVHETATAEDKKHWQSLFEKHGIKARISE